MGQHHPTSHKDSAFCSCLVCFIWKVTATASICLLFYMENIILLFPSREARIAGITISFTTLLHFCFLSCLESRISKEHRIMEKLWWTFLKNTKGKYWFELSLKVQIIMHFKSVHHLCLTLCSQGLTARTIAKASQSALLKGCTFFFYHQLCLIFKMIKK